MATPNRALHDYCFNCHAHCVPEEDDLHPVKTETEDDNSADNDNNIRLIAVDVDSDGYYTYAQPTTANSTEPSSPSSITVIDLLTYAFELQTSDVEQLQELNLTAQPLCSLCLGLLTKLYTARQQFQKLTHKKSRLVHILGSGRRRSRVGRTRRDLTDLRSSGSRAVKNRGNLPENNSFVETDAILEDSYEDLEVPDLSSSSSVIIYEDDQGQIQSGTLLYPVVRLTRLNDSNYQISDKPPRKKIRKKSSPCEECGMTFASNCTLQKHLRKQICRTRPRPNQPQTNTRYNFTCPICGDPFIGAGGHRLEEHMRKHMSPEEKAQELICCEITHTTLKNLHTHRKTESCQAPRLTCTLNKPLTKRTSVCPECGKTINSVVPSALKHHIDLIHRRSSKFICHVCGRPMPSQKSIGEHLVTHFSAEEKKIFNAGRDRTHLCQLCGMSFYKKYHLTSHTKAVHNPDADAKAKTGVHRKKLSETQI